MGKQRIVISERDNLAVLFEDDSAVEFIIHRGDVLLGDVYLAQVENILPSIDAAFVNVGMDRMGFLHSSDVQGRGDLKNRLQPKQNVVVQVMKEPTGHKGPRVTTNIALPGRFLVLMPESKGISISRKIAETKERSRLKSTVSLLKPPGVGVIIRTEAEDQSESEIQEDFETLIERWQHIVAMADTAKPPALLYRDQDILYRVIREMVTEDVKEIVVDTAFGQQRAQQLLQNWGIEHPIKVTLYSGQQNIIVGTGVDKEIKQALQTKVPLPSGGYLYIQPTEALCVIDVNSGKFTSLQSQAETIRLTNLEAAKEIARQLRLRNIGGMIIVDFIDMENRAHQLSILENFENELSTDKAKPQIGQLSDLGLVEMTRHRQGQALLEIFTRKCVSCSGNGQTMEDFVWSPSGDARGVPRHKLPIRQQQRGPNDRGERGPREGGPQQGQVGQPQNGQQGQQQQGGNRQPLPKAGAQSIRRFIDPRAAHQTPLREGFLQQSKDAADKEEKAATESMSLLELYRHRLLKKLGIRLASCAKVAKMPLGINAVMVRINPKSADVFTLVDAIEGSGGYLPSDTYGDYEEGGDGYGGEYGEDDAPPEPEQPQQPQRQGQRDNRDRGNRRRDVAAETPGEEMPDAEEADEGFEDNESEAEGRGAVAVRERPGVDMDEYEPMSDESSDEDEEDEVAPESPRRRGRPPKAVAPAEVDDDVDADDIEVDVDAESDAEAEPTAEEGSPAAEGPPKRRRGRPRRAK